jgi:hypothetical protein
MTNLHTSIQNHGALIASVIQYIENMQKKENSIISEIENLNPTFKQTAHSSCPSCNQAVSTIYQQ